MDTIKVRLVSDWRWVLARSWSVRFIAIAAVLSGLETAMAVFADNPPIPKGTFALLSFFVTAAALIARFVAQSHEE